jgi:L-alanine-DL-glutamate epimerase-like enolase superfamily enzyme
VPPAAIFNFDIGQVGGIGEAKKIASMAEAHSPSHRSNGTTAT